MNLEIRNTSEYKRVSTEGTFILLETTENGLADSEAKKRIELFGYNEVAERKKNPLLEFLLRFWGPMPWLLELAMGLSLALKHYLEGMIILVLLTINAIIGHIHSRGSQKAMDLLRKKLAIKAKVLRDGEWVIKEAKEIVPGDLIAVGLGDIVPADAKVISGELSVDQSTLTGESLPVEAYQSNIIYSSSIVRRGEARCVVVNTGSKTYFGKTAELVKIAKPKSHQEEIMMSIIKYMMYLGIAALILILIYGLILDIREHLVMILTLTVIFLMGAVPVALPAVMTIVQTVGAMELVRKGVLVTRLDSIEDAASIDVLCLDKTGTITQNKLSVTDSLPSSGFKKEDVIIIGAFASEAEPIDVIDRSVIDFAKKSGVDFTSFKQVSYTPFNPTSKRTEAVIEAKGRRFRVVKGADQVVMSLCRGIDDETLRKTNQAIEDLSRRGYRTLAVGISDDESLDGLRFAGLLSLSDPPRPDSRDMIEEAIKFGIKPMMLTGDNIAIAKETAKQVGIGDRIIRMADLNGLKEDEQLSIIKESDGLAEIYPEDKYKIVKLLQSGQHTVGMTGDGVNDAPALKQAEMGIAVSNSTDVAKASASVVLTEPGIEVIIDTIRISRQTYQRMLSWVINKVAKVIQFIGVLTAGFFLYHSTVLSLLGVSLLVFANDFVTMSLSTDNVTYTSNPNKWNVKNITLASLFMGLFLIAEGIIAILIGTDRFHLRFERLQAYVMLLLVFTSQFRVLIIRERRHFWSSQPGKILLLSTILTTFGFALMGLYGILIPSITLNQVLFLLVFSALFTFGIDPFKYYIFRKFGL